ncbi:MAG: DUF4870 domain-containing protein [Oscillatoriales cyanobacterium RU_3_3]|nr:DUF4870 domain-containing protein [Oscillatoriales cyanobacterium RU_3_3]
MDELPDLQKRKLLSALCHVSTFLSWFVIPVAVPIVVLCVSDDPVVQENAKEAINYYISFVLFYVISGVLVFGLIGIPLLVLTIVADYVLPIMAIVHCLTNLSKPYHYPFIFRLV